MTIIKNTTPPLIEDVISIIDENHYEKHGYYLSRTEPEEFTKIVAIEFAKLHVQEALKQASEKAILDYGDFISDGYFEKIIDKDSILNAYPLENIK